MEVRGANGSGKSTLLRCVAGLYADYTGHIEASQSWYCGHKLGLSLVLSAEQNLAWYRGLAGDASDIAAALERVGMRGYERVACGSMSAGQQRRVALARMLVGARPLWLLDEPLTALDVAGQELVRSLIGEHISGGGAVVCATHQPLELVGARQLQLGERA